MAKSILEVRDLCKTYTTRGGEVEALQHVDLTVERGEIFGIIGMSGAGKSSLVRCINLLETPTSGSVLFDGQDMVAAAPAQLRKARRSISMVFQQFNLLMQRTALRNVSFPMEIAGVPKKEACAKAADLLETVGLSDWSGSYPSQLSGGQKQRVAIARALATEPKMLLCDEATSALDPSTTLSILQLLKKINTTYGITILVITHQMNVIEEICSKVAILSSGKVVETGPVREIFANPKTEAAKKLVLPGPGQKEQALGRRQVRIVFDGVDSCEPVVAQLVLHFQSEVNIMYADTRDINGKAVGQMVLQLPEDRSLGDRMIAFCKARGLTAEEVTADEQ
ncbi:MAG: ATP-binding cassette domain-containing protein [Oscillospiraceae bacterium]|nr:ATP-binding cassette domain-containing protein [Oscillospiraceae bacterium]MDD3261421.1 ATP-binding cassette domain-containing protein [Oscillospiraceae bacterium]